MPKAGEPPVKQFLKLALRRALPSVIPEVSKNSRKLPWFIRNPDQATFAEIRAVLRSYTGSDDCCAESDCLQNAVFGASADRQGDELDNRVFLKQSSIVFDPLSVRQSGQKFTITFKKRKFVLAKQKNAERPGVLVRTQLSKYVFGKRAKIARSARAG